MEPTSSFVRRLTKSLCSVIVRITFKSLDDDAVVILVPFKQLCLQNILFSLLTHLNPGKKITVGHFKLIECSFMLIST